MTTTETDNTLLNSLESRGQVELLNDIDLLRSQGLGHFEVSLPQIIVCGDQSSGKSSVLEALSRVQFPTKDELCTRFATEVVLRKAATEHARVTIIPGKSCDDEERNRLLHFKSLHASLEEFAVLVEAAQTEILSSKSSAFSDNVLRVEISGPNLPQLTIVDLPGIIHSQGKQQTEADVKLVTKLVKSYMENQRSIILTVVTAKNDISNQIVLTMARAVDPEGSRTLGVITKPDTLHPGSNSELTFMELAKNENIKFHLGWHVLRNRDFDTKDVSSAMRDEAERQFFAEGIWKTLPRNTVGIDALRGRLSRVLLEHITTELPALIDDIELGIEDCEGRLSHLGESRVSVKEQRTFLMRISQRFQSLVKAATDGDYSDSFFGDSFSDEGYSKRLRAVIQNLNTDFSRLMATNGHRLDIRDDVSDSFNLKRTDHSSSDVPQPRVISRSDYVREVSTMMKRNRGRELPGTFNPLLISDIFYVQAEPWQGLAGDHIQQIWEASKTLLELVLSTLLDDGTCASLQAQVVDPFMRERLSQLNSKLKQILGPHQRGHPVTYNHYFTETIQKARQERSEKDMTQRFYAHFGHNPENPPKSINVGPTLSIDSVQKLISSLTSRTEADMDLYACSEIVDCMQAYYKVALKVLIDNVASLAIENCLMEGLLEILSPANIMDMDDDLITAIAAEPEEAQNERQLATEKLKVLEAGLQTCKRYVRRRTTINRRPNATADIKSQTATPSSSFRDPVVSRSVFPSAAPTTAIPQVNGSAPLLFTSAKTPSTSVPSSGNFGGSGFGGFGRSSDSGQSTGQGGLFGPVPSTQSISVPSSGNFGGGSGFGDFESSSNSGQTPGQRSLFGTVPTTQSGAKATNGYSFHQTTKNSSSLFGGAPATKPALSGSSSRPLSHAGGFTSDTSQESPLAKLKSSTPEVNGAYNFGGTGTVPFRAHTKQEKDDFNCSQMSHFQSISCMEPYGKWSFEELRLADYNQGRGQA